MNSTENPFEARIRVLLHEMADQITASESTLLGAPHRRRALRTSVVKVVTIVLLVTTLAAVPFLALRTSGRAGPIAALDLGGAPPDLVAIMSTGAVELIAPRSGDVVRTLAVPNPTDRSGHHLGLPYSLSATSDTVFIAYRDPSFAIERVPISGGELTFVAYGEYPSVRSDGKELAYITLSAPASQKLGSVESLVIQSVATGTQLMINPLPGSTAIDGLSWAPDGTQLVLTGAFYSDGTRDTPPEIVAGVQLFETAEAFSSSNPFSVGSSSALSQTTIIWRDGQYLGPAGAVSVLVSDLSDGCGNGPTQVLSLTPPSHDATRIAAFSFDVSHVIFDSAGRLIAYQRAVLPTVCAQGTKTTRGTGSEGGPESAKVSTEFSAFPSNSNLYVWTGEGGPEIASGVIYAIALPSSNP